MGGSWWRLATWSNNAGEVSHGGGGRNDEYTLTKTELTRLNGGGGRGDRNEAMNKMAGAFL